MYIPYYYSILPTTVPHSSLLPSPTAVNYSTDIATAVCSLKLLCGVEGRVLSGRLQQADDHVDTDQYDTGHAAHHRHHPRHICANTSIKQIISTRTTKNTDR